MFDNTLKVTKFKQPHLPIFCYNFKKKITVNIKTLTFIFRPINNNFRAIGDWNFVIDGLILFWLYAQATQSHKKLLLHIDFSGYEQNLGFKGTVTSLRSLCDVIASFYIQNCTLSIRNKDNFRLIQIHLVL